VSDKKEQFKWLLSYSFDGWKTKVNQFFYTKTAALIEQENLTLKKADTILRPI